MATLTPLRAQVQPAGSFEELRFFAKPGDTITIRESGGKSRRGTLQQLSGDALSVNLDGRTQRFSQTSVVEVRQRLRDSLRNGWLIGAAVGVGTGVAQVAYDCSHYSSCRTADIGTVAFNTGLGMLLGTVVDASIRKTSVVYRPGSTTTLTAQPNATVPGIPARTIIDLRDVLRYSEEVIVTEQNGSTLKGNIVEVSSKSVRVRAAGTTLEFDQTQIRNIQRRRKDVWWNGALIGISAGGLTGALLANAACGPRNGECTGNAVPAGLVGGVAIGVTAGALIDFSIKKMEPAFQAPTSLPRPPQIGLSPILTKDRRGLSVHISLR